MERMNEWRPTEQSEDEMLIDDMEIFASLNDDTQDPVEVRVGKGNPRSMYGKVDYNLYKGSNVVDRVI